LDEIGDFRWKKNDILDNIFFYWSGILVICEHACDRICDRIFFKNPHIAYFTAYNGIFKISDIYLCI